MAWHVVLVALSLQVINKINGFSGAQAGAAGACHRESDVESFLQKGAMFATNGAPGLTNKKATNGGSQKSPNDANVPFWMQKVGCHALFTTCSGTGVAILPCSAPSTPYQQHEYNDFIGRVH